jgi:splicing factor 3B subunit 2
MPDVTVKKEGDLQEMENVEYVSEQLDSKEAALEAFSDVFARFQIEPEDSPVRRAHESPTYLPILLFL